MVTDEWTSASERQQAYVKGHARSRQPTDRRVTHNTTNNRRLLRVGLY